MLSLVACACKLPPLLGASSWESRARAGETSGTGIRWPHCYSERMRDSERGELWQFGDYDHQRFEAKKSSLNPDGYLRAKTLILEPRKLTTLLFQRKPIVYDMSTTLTEDDNY